MSILLRNYLMTDEDGHAFILRATSTVTAIRAWERLEELERVHPLEAVSVATDFEARYFTDVDAYEPLPPDVAAIAEGRNAS